MQEKTAEEKPAEQTEQVQKTAPEHTFNTETPRGAASYESVVSNVLKNAQTDVSPILKMAREVGHAEITRVVGAAIKRGDFYQPSRQEIEDQISW
jgi:hypothetical protein